VGGGRVEELANADDPAVPEVDDVDPPAFNGIEDGP
jgi:hypothetical protein